MLGLFEEYILPASIIVNDCYPSYPRAVEEYNSQHERVNHSIGCVNENGAHTN